MTDTLDQPTRYCPTCARSLPVTDFRLVRAGSDKRRRQCRSCRTTADQLPRLGKDRREIAFAMTELRRHSSSDAILDILRQLASQFGGVNGFCQRVREALEGAPLKCRIKIFQSLVQCAVNTEARRDAEAIRSAEPAALLERLHSEGKLKPLMRAAFKRGLFRFEDLDPWLGGFPP